MFRFEAMNPLVLNDPGAGQTLGAQPNVEKSAGRHQSLHMAWISQLR